MLGVSNLKNKDRYNSEKILFNRRNTLILVILDTLGILSICWKTQAANSMQNGFFNLFDSGLSGLGESNEHCL